MRRFGLLVLPLGFACAASHETDTTLAPACGEFAGQYSIARIESVDPKAPATRSVAEDLVGACVEISERTMTVDYGERRVAVPLELGEMQRSLVTPAEPFHGGKLGLTKDGFVALNLRGEASLNVYLRCPPRALEALVCLPSTAEGNRVVCSPRRTGDRCASRR